MRLYFPALAAAFSFLVFTTPTPCYGVYPATSFNEIAQTADIIFAGTVASIDQKTSGTAPYTEVTFDQVSLVHAGPDSRQSTQSQIVLRYAGGPTPQGEFLRISDTPEFHTGRRYFLFAHDDGQNYLTPIIGGPQGLFEIIVDPTTGEALVARPGGRAVTGIAPSGQPALTPTPVTGTAPRNSIHASDRYVPQIAISSTGQIAPAGRRTRDIQTSAPVSVSEFDGMVKQALRKPIAHRVLQTSTGPGQFLRLGSNGQLESQLLIKPEPAGAPTSAPLSSVRKGNAENSESATPLDTRGQTLIQCTYQNVPIIMEQLPEDFWSYSVTNDCMVEYNRYVDIFRFYKSDGSVGNNDRNEFGGTVDDTKLAEIYISGWKWGSTLGVCFSYNATSDPCSRLIQTDVFWNPNRTYSTDYNVWMNNDSGTYNLKAILMHEVGHVWGYQQGDPEQYNYDEPSVMHAIYNNIFETGHGLHARDAYIYRRHYGIDNPVLPVTDVGIESYYTQDGLNPSTAHVSGILGPGAVIDFKNVTVENMSRTNLQNARVRFYLATKRDLTGDEYQVGPDYTYSTLYAESWTTNDFLGNTVPAGISSGSYYIVAYVDRVSGGTGIGDDNYNNNFAAFSTKVTYTNPALASTPATIYRSTDYGTNAATGRIGVYNSGGGVLNYNLGVSYVSGGSGWISLAKTSGESRGGMDYTDITFNTSSLMPGSYLAQIVISSPGLANKTINVGVDVSSPPPPGNDNLADAAWLFSTLSGSVGSSSIAATKEIGEPAHAGQPGGASVWYTWQAPAAGITTIHTEGSTFDTVLGVYTGSSFPLELVAADDDSGAGRASRVTFTSAYQTVYKIAVDGFNGAAGNVNLTWDVEAFPAAVNDWSIY